MVRYEVDLDIELCHGCGYCVLFCPRGCIEFSGEQPGPMYSGYEVPRFIHQERCNGCGICSRMCPCGAIEVNLAIEEIGKDLKREKVAGLPKLLYSVGFGDCVGCQKATIGRMIIEVLSEIGMDGKFIGLDAIRCPSSTAFGKDFKVMIEREGRSVPLQGDALKDIIDVDLEENPIVRALELKRDYPDRIVFVVQDGSKLDTLGLETFNSSIQQGGNVTIIYCKEMIYRGDNPIKDEKGPPASPLYEPDRRILTLSESPIFLAEQIATFGEVNYCARGAITSPYEYERTKGYIKAAFQNQIDGFGIGFIEVLSACFAQAYRSPYETLKWIHDGRIQKWPFKEFRNENFYSNVYK